MASTAPKVLEDRWADDRTIGWLTHVAETPYGWAAAVALWWMNRKRKASKNEK